MSETDLAQMREEQRDRLLMRAFAPPRRFTAEERNAAGQALKAKGEASQILAQELAELRRVATMPAPGERELGPVPDDAALQQAVRAYHAALAEYRQRNKVIDRALTQQLSLDSQAMCLTLGLLDNGLGGPAMGGRGGTSTRPPAGGSGGRGGSGAMSAEQTERLLSQASLTGQEKSAAAAALGTKDKARQILAQELAKLRRLANSPNPGEQEPELVPKDAALGQALKACRAALDDYRQKVDAADAALVKQLSVQSQARCLALGILENGVGSIATGGGRGGTGTGAPGAQGVGGRGQ
jgi:hypothetical protein